MLGRPRGTIPMQSFAIAISAAVALLGSATPTIAAPPPDSAAPPPQGVIFVDDDAPPGGNGHNWRQAFRHLQDALAYAESPGNDVREIRVAQGTYKPDHGLWVEPLDQHATFFLIDGVALRGGYRGHDAEGGADAVAAGNPHERNIDLYRTVLSGDLLGDLFSYDDNSFHIVTAIHVGPRTELEGFEIREATDDPDALPPEPTSGALLVIGGAPLIQRCTFADNRGHNDSGSCVLNDTEAVIQKCRFLFNLSNGNAGGMSITFGHPKVEDCTFTNNVAFYGAGGALGGWATEAEIRRCTFIDNSAGNGGSAIYMGISALAQISDCGFIGNAADIGGAIRFGGCLFERCRFIDNFAATSGGAIAGGGHFVHCLFEGNRTSWQGGGAIHGGGDFLNCVFRENIAGSEVAGGGALWFNSYPATVTNCIFYRNRSFGPASAIFIEDGHTSTLFPS
jgi:predicted outer membrane repeat protein